jgi:hypothetical protein
MVLLGNQAITAHCLGALLPMAGVVALVSGAIHGLCFQRYARHHTFDFRWMEISSREINIVPRISWSSITGAAIQQLNSQIESVGRLASWSNPALATWESIGNSIEVELMRRRSQWSNLGMTDEEYAKNKRMLIREGRIN